MTTLLPILRKKHANCEQVSSSAQTSHQSSGNAPTANSGEAGFEHRNNSPVPRVTEVPKPLSAQIHSPLASNLCPMSFEDLDVWKRAARLSATLYQQTKELRDFGFRDQLTRSGLSIPSNIAEGLRKTGSGSNSAQHPKGRPGYWCLTPFFQRNRSRLPEQRRRSRMGGRSPTNRPDARSSDQSSSFESQEMTYCVSFSPLVSRISSLAF